MFFYIFAKTNNGIMFSNICVYGIFMTQCELPLKVRV